MLGPLSLKMVPYPAPSHASRRNSNWIGVWSMVKPVILVDNEDALPVPCDPLPLMSKVHRSSNDVPPVVNELLMKLNCAPGTVPGNMSNGVVLKVSAFAGAMM